MTSLAAGLDRAPSRRAFRPVLIAGAAALALLAGCATQRNGDPPPGGHASHDPKDPYEKVNRKIFAFNDTVDKYALKPVAQAYEKVVPNPIRLGIHNFFGNFSDAWSAVNQLLQGKPHDSATMTLRVLTNTTVGLAGLFDVATPMGLERKPEDMGQTLGVWGLEPGPYLVLPLFGSSDVRDAVGLPFDAYVSPSLLVNTTWQKVGVDAVGVVDTRAGLLGASQMLDELAFDRYTFLRDAYVTRRRSLVYDGNPPPLPGEDDDDDSDPGKPTAAPAPAGGASAAAPAATTPVPLPNEAASGPKSSAADAPHGLVGSAAPVAQLPASAPAPAPMPPQPASAVQPAPMPASAPPLPIPLPGPAPVPPPPASAPSGS
ncbi:MAG: MlaA family lipoprotein [Burkholderiaceae bacterium]